MMKICTRCVLSEKIPGIAFDEAGVCNFCGSGKALPGRAEQKQKTEQRFRQLIEAHRGRGGYDCLVAYSGGKDSTYTLHLMKNVYGLRVLALSVNNWFQSERALANIKTIVQRLNVDHLAISPPFESFKKLIRLSVSENLYSSKALERASAVCVSCISLVRYACFKTALEKKIPFTVLGMTPGQASVKAALVPANPEMLITMQRAVFQPIEAHVPDITRPYQLRRDDFFGANLPYNVNPLSFLEYDETAIIAAIQELGWIKPDDTDHNSTNCLLNAYANKVHLDRFGFHPYAHEIAGLVREGCLARDEGLARITGTGASEAADRVARQLQAGDGAGSASTFNPKGGL